MMIGGRKSGGDTMNGMEESKEGMTNRMEENKEDRTENMRSGMVENKRDMPIVVKEIEKNSNTWKICKTRQPR